MQVLVINHVGLNLSQLDRRSASEGNCDRNKRQV